jgi:hypothetical protein
MIIRDAFICVVEIILFKQNAHRIDHHFLALNIEAFGSAPVFDGMLIVD